MTQPICRALAVLSLAACSQLATARAPHAALPMSATRRPLSLAASSAPILPSESEASSKVSTSSETRPRMYLVNRLERAVTLLRSSDGSLLAAAGSLFSKLSRNGIVPDERASEGMPPDGEVFALAGRYPDAAWVIASEPRARSPVAELLLLRGQRSGWSRAEAGPSGGEYLAIGNWSQGRVLAARYAWSNDQRARYGFQLLAGRPAQLPVFSRAPRAKTLGKDPCAELDALVAPQRIDIQTSGDVYSIGSPCNDPRGVVEHWRPGHARSEITPIPGPGEWTVSAFLPSRDGALSLVADDGEGTILAHFDGRRWRTEKLAVSGTLDRVERAPDGALFVLAHEEVEGVGRQARLWRRLARDSHFTELSLPTDADGKPLAARGPSSLAALSAADAWLFIDGRLLHTQPAPSGPRDIELEHGQQLPADVHARKLATERCQDVFVLLFTVSASAPVDYDFPELRSSLAGHPHFARVSVIETEDNGTRYLGAVVPDFELGQQLVELANKAVKNATPALLCAHPMRTRQLAVAWD